MRTKGWIMRMRRPTWLFQLCPLRESLYRGVIFQWEELDMFMWLARATQHAT